jgi:hypothetical protein
MLVSRIISGGQAGVDRAALDAARSHGISIGGTVPSGWLTEDGNPDHWRAEYPELVESGSSDYRVRTVRNIVDADATLIIMGGEDISHHRGSMLTYDRCLSNDRPVLISDADDADRVCSWLRSLGRDHIILNVAGPRASGAKGIYTVAFMFMNIVLTGLDDDLVF